jgi:vacuolar-type H+-ATPase subunit H
LVKADSPIHGWDVAWDNALETAGLKSPGEVAVERASEVAVAEERNHSAASEKALQQFNRAVAEANNEDRERLQRAEQVLSQVKERVPEQARQGISNALENVERAKNRVPDRMTVSGRNGSGGMLPDIKLPDVGGQDIEAPGSDNRPERNSRR